MAVKLGMDAKLNRNTGSFASPTWNPIPNVKDLTLSLATLKDASLEFEMVWDTEDDDFTAIRNAFLNNTPVEMAVLDGAHNVVGSQGLRASFMVTSFTRNEPLEEAITVSVSMKVTYSANAPAWMTVVS
jgi:hypothetical protein